MALVVQVSKDPGLPLAPPGPAGSGDSAAVPDIFQSLLASLLGTQGMQTTPGASALLDGAGARPGDASDGATGDPLEDSKKASLLAALAQLLPGIQPQPIPESAGASAAGARAGQAVAGQQTPVTGAVALQVAITAAAGEPTGAADGASRAVATSVPGDEAKATAGAATAHAAAEDAAVVLAGAQQGTQAAAPGTSQAPATQAAILAVANQGAAPPPVAFEAVPNAKAGHLEKALKADDASGTASPPDGSPPGAQQPDLGVVRSVGNANEQGTTGSDTAANPAAGKQAPRAPLEGIASASPQSALHRSADAPTASADQAQQPAPAAPQPPEAVRQVAQAVIDQVQRGNSEARLHLQPEQLGDVVVRIHADGDHIRVEIRADRPDAVQVMRDHTVDLSSMLGNQGLNLSDVWVGLGGQQAGNSHDFQQATPNRPGTNDFASILGADDPAATDLHNRLRAAYNPDGSHLYRV